MPDFSTVCRRQKTLQVELSYQRTKSALQLLVDSTGIKFLGEGECRRKRHGAEYRREYRSCWHRLRPTSASKASARMVPTTHEAAGTPSLSGNPAARERQPLEEVECRLGAPQRGHSRPQALGSQPLKKVERLPPAQLCADEAALLQAV